MKTYFITQEGTNTPRSVKAITPAMAMVTLMDKHFKSYYGPMLVGEYFEIYSDMGHKLRFKVV